MSVINTSNASNGSVTHKRNGKNIRSNFPVVPAPIAKPTESDLVIELPKAYESVLAFRNEKTGAPHSNPFAAILVWAKARLGLDTEDKTVRIPKALYETIHAHVNAVGRKSIASFASDETTTNHKLASRSTLKKGGIDGTAKGFAGITTDTASSQKAMTKEACEIELKRLSDTREKRVESLVKRFDEASSKDKAKALAKWTRYVKTFERWNESAKSFGLKGNILPVAPKGSALNKAIADKAKADKLVASNGGQKSGSKASK